MIIVHPNLVCGSGDFENLAAKQLVYLLISLPEAFFIQGIQGEVMEKRPDGLIGESPIIVLDLRTGKEYRVTILFGQVPGDAFAVSGS
jgi:hypothetical protein